MSLIQKVFLPVIQMETQRTWNNIFKASGVHISELWISDVQDFYRELALGIFSPGWISARFGELFVAWKWDPQNWVDTILTRILGNKKAMDIINNHLANKLYDSLKKWSHRKPESVGKAHYDIPEIVYTRMLGKTMKYTSPTETVLDEDWKFSLNSSQKVAMEMICQRTELFEGAKVLEIGFWYGTLADHAIRNHKVQVTWLTVSQGQKSFAEDYWKYNDTSNQSHFRLQDWKKLYFNLNGKTSDFLLNYKGEFDRIISIEMIEAVSTEDLPLFFQFLYECLNDDGILFLQAINSDRMCYCTEAFIDKYIFPDGVVPQHLYLLECAQRAWFQTGVHARDIATQAYDLALMEWHKNLAEGYDDELAQELDYHFNNNHTPAFPYRNHPSFLKIFEYYLKSCAASFRSGYNRDGQYKFYKDSKSKTQALVQATPDEVIHILQTKEFWEMPKK
jgi:cyclopropane-fatty-acyl-phospholipid synthase